MNGNRPYDTWRRRNAGLEDLFERDSQRDIGAEILEAIRQFKAGKIGAVHGLPGAVILRCVNLGSLGDISGDDLDIGKIYVARKDREGWVRIIDQSGEDYLYPMACFEEIKPLAAMPSMDVTLRANAPAELDGKILATRRRPALMTHHRSRTMTTAAERTRALLSCGGFLVEIARNEQLPLEVRQHAARIARHFPTVEDFRAMAAMRSAGFDDAMLVSPDSLSDWQGDCPEGPLLASTRLEWPTT